MPRMHEDELDLDEALVRRLLAEQLPQWAELRLPRIEGPAGTVNAILRLGDALSVRLPVEIPLPVGQGRPSDAYYAWENSPRLVREAESWLEVVFGLAGDVERAGDDHRGGARTRAGGRSHPQPRARIAAQPS